MRTMTSDRSLSRSFSSTAGYTVVSYGAMIGDRVRMHAFAAALGEVVADDTTVIDGIGKQFEKKAGVQTVVYAKQSVEWIYTVSNFLQWVFLAVALALLLGSLILIWNTIRTAMFARRREIEVMKLVGATNWFIRIPFMIEGLVQGLIGALLACGFVWGANTFWTSNVVEKISVVDLQQLQVSSGELRWTCITLILLGMGVGALGSGIAVTKFLDV